MNANKCLPSALRFCIVILCCFWAAYTIAQKATIHIYADKLGARVSPSLHGAFFEEISHGGEGGLYAELIQNRGFEDAETPKGDTLRDGKLIPPRTPHYSMANGQVSDWWMSWNVNSDYPGWSQTGNLEALKLKWSKDFPLTMSSPHSLRVEVLKAGTDAALRNDGFWGINIVKHELYLLKFYLYNPKNNYKGSVTAALVDPLGNRIVARVFPVVRKRGWMAYTAILDAPVSDKKAHFELSFSSKGILYVDFVSLFPKHTFKNRRNGLRQDLAQKIADLKPAFLRWPGGCFVEGINIQSAPNWKETIGPVEKRHSTFSVWDYYTSNGFGYDEYLQFCEDIGAKALYVFNVGIACEMRSGTYVTDEQLQPYIQDALDAIEYAIGSVNTKWGSLRARNGHPKPYPLESVEVGNEQHGAFYAKRYNLFYDAIHKKFPGIKIIASMGIGDIDPYTLKDMQHIQYADEHSYKGAYWSMANYDHFDKYTRNHDWKMYVGEYATNNGVDKGNMIASLSDAVYVMGMEKNSDLVKMSSYAPLLVNVNDEDWPVNLINFDNANSYGRISYYMLKMMNENKATVNIESDLSLSDIPKEDLNAFSGGIGLATWDTYSAYKDIEVQVGGKTIYQSDFIKNPEEWKGLRGNWSVIDSGLTQTADGAQTYAYLKNKTFTNYTLKMKAKKLDGYNGFIIPFAVQDTNTFKRLHIGAWVNAVTLVESVNNGYDVGNLSSPVKLPFKIEKGKWYDIELKVMGDSIAGYIDDQLLITYKEPRKLFALAGKDEKNKELILKIVNAYGKTYETNIAITGVSKITSNAIISTLAAPSPDAENSFENPTKYVPVIKHISNASKDFHLSLQPYSISIIRIKAE